MRESGEVPQRLADKLLLEGIPVRPGATVTDIIDMVLSSQEQYMLKERRNGPRRRRLTFIPSDEELVQVISHRFRN